MCDRIQVRQPTGVSLICVGQTFEHCGQMYHVQEDPVMESKGEGTVLCVLVDPITPQSKVVNYHGEVQVAFNQQFIDAATFGVHILWSTDWCRPSNLERDQIYIAKMAFCDGKYVR